MYLGKCHKCPKGYMSIMHFKDTDDRDCWYAFCDRCCDTFAGSRGRGTVVTRTLRGLERSWVREGTLRGLREL